MAQRSHVPKFGNWENEENVPYTAYFDKARKDRTGTKMINPNDPEENPDILSDYSSSADTSLTNKKADGGQKPAEDGAVRSAHEDSDLRQFANSPGNHNNLGRRPSNDLANQRHGGAGRGAVSGDTHRRPARQSAGSEQSIEKSPLHRHARATGRDSPSWEGKSAQEGSHGTPGRSRLRPRGDETPDHGAAVPKFGEWDETNPASADGFTHIFNKVREERQIGAGRVGTPEPPYPHARKQVPDDSAKGCCFPWCRK